MSYVSLKKTEELQTEKILIIENMKISLTVLYTIYNNIVFVSIWRSTKLRKEKIKEKNKTKQEKNHWLIEMARLSQHRMIIGTIATLFTILYLQVMFTPSRFKIFEFVYFVCRLKYNVSFRQGRNFRPVEKIIS